MSAARRNRHPPGELFSFAPSAWRVRVSGDAFHATDSQPVTFDDAHVAHVGVWQVPHLRHVIAIPGRRRIHAVHSTRAEAETRLAELGVARPPARHRQPGLPFAA